jgi:hypothetical protein
MKRTNVDHQFGEVKEILSLEQLHLEMKLNKTTSDVFVTSAVRQTP